MADVRPRPVRRTRPARPLRLAVPVLVAALGASACVGVPTSGPVREGAAVAAGGENRGSAIRVVPQPPQDGENQAEIVEGFLDASASFDDDHRYARMHLDRPVSSRWDPATRVVVYDGTEPPLTQEGERTVVLEADHVATISDQGQYTPAPAGSTVRAEFRLDKVAGEWRISDLPDGLYLTRNDVTRSFRPVNLYFPSPDARVLVPDPVYLPLERPGLATVATRVLLAGPTDWLAPAVRTAFPPGTRLFGSEVTVDSQGVATVALTPEVRDASEDDLEALSAQLVWTLRQVPEVTSVRVTAGTTTLNVPGAGAVQSRDSWPSWSPDALPPSAVGYFLQRGRLVAVEEEGLSPLPAPRPETAAPLRDPAVSLDEERVAALSVGTDALRTGLLGPGERLSTRLTGTSFTGPSWDLLGNAWVVDNAAGDRGPRVWAVPASGDARRVEADGLGDAEVLDLRVARDGTRVAVVTVSGGIHRLLVGRVVRDSGLRVEAFRDVTGPLVEVSDVAWAASDRLAVLGRESQGVEQAWVVDVDGSSFDGRGAVPGMESVAAAPATPGTRPLLVGSEAGYVFQSPAANTWQRLGDGTDPLYPG